MPMEVLAVDRLTDKARFQSDVAVAIADAMDITLRAQNFVTMPVLETHLAALEVKLESRFASVENSIASAKIWAVTLYGALCMVMFGAFTANHYYLVNREDQTQVRTDQRFQLVDARFQQMDERFRQVDIRFQQVETHLQQVDVHLQQVDTHLQQLDTELKEIHALLTKRSHRRSR